MEPKDRNEIEQRQLEELERKLRFAMRHRQAPAGLKQRVLATARERRRMQQGRGWMLRRIAASAVLAMMFGGFAVYRQVEERAKEQQRGEATREQVMTALRITSRTLDRVGDRVSERLSDGR